ncbi:MULTISPECIES: acyltransferase [unclassified Caballeronia]|uniref:acyltransferase n=1 Tax=unclassified Caballeronia TaxID=2646786 RepID=UPI0020295FB2
MIGANVQIGPFVVVGDATIGDGSVIHPHATIADGVRLGKDVEIFHGALLGKEPKGAGATARVPKYDKFIEVGDNCSIGPNAVIFYGTAIGASTLLGDGASIRENCKIGHRCILSRYVTVNYDTVIGDRTKVMDNSHITGRAVIGNDVFISVSVGTTNDNVITAGFGDHIQGPVIEDGAIVGVGASLLPAVRIGSKATVAAGSVVTKDVKANTLVAGVPARFVKSLD